VELQAGPLTALLEDGDLRYIRLGDREIVRRVCIAVRAVNWDTAHGIRSELNIDRGGDRFSVSYASRHCLRDIAFRWLATIEGTADGTITFSMRGIAEAPFEYGRIGVCILHPPATCAGRPYRAETPDGSVEGLLPTLIEPQLKDRGVSLPLFPWFSGLQIALDGVEVNFDLEGDRFGMEDQRNWTDASFKTYSTPPIRGRRHAMALGDILGQRVTISVSGPAVDEERARMTRVRGPVRPGRAGELTPPPAPRDEGPPSTLLLGPELGVPMPHLGLGIAAHGEPLSPREVDLLGRLRLDHLRADLRLWESARPAALEHAAGQAAALSCGLELALFVSDDGEAELTTLAEAVRAAPLDGVAVTRVLVFHEPGAAWETTAGRWVELARDRLSPLLQATKFGGGTNGYFAELTRMRPEISAMDIVSYTANPQVHALDEASLAENLEALATTVRSARTFCGDREIAVSRLTLKPPFNQDEPEAHPVAEGELPSSVDPRQVSLFGAGWTVGALKYLAEAGAASVTLYETTGWAGVIERERGCAVPDLFPSRPGMVFPMYHVLADLARWNGTGRPAACLSSDPLSLVGLAVRYVPGSDVAGWHGPPGGPGRGWGLLIANLGDTPRPVCIRRVDGPIARNVRARYLDSNTVYDAMFKPDQFRARWSTLETHGGDLSLDLSAYALACIEIAEA
jgi:hypothetical protein